MRPVPHQQGLGKPDNKNRILIVEDHPIFRQGMIHLINHEPDLEVCGEVETAARALSAIDDLKPDLALVDITIKGTNGIELIKNIKFKYPALPTLVLSMHEEALYAERAIRAGAHGYVMKQEAASQVMAAIRSVLRGEIYLSAAMNVELIQKFVGGGDRRPQRGVESLTDRELEVLQWIGKGHTSREIASQINISIKTVESHRERLKEKLGLRSAPELVRYAVEWLTSRV
jgi:DNA-binding NarL/FixJ family response regulator